MDIGIYCIKNTKDGKVYVGSSIELKERRKRHFWSLSRGSHYNRYLQRAYDKHGLDAFEYAILEIVDANDLMAREEYWIKILNSSIAAAGYNLATYESGRKIITEQARINIGIARRNRPPFTDETRRKMSASHTGLKHKPMSEAGRQNLIKARAPQKGVPLSAETRRKMSVARAIPWNKGKRMSDEARQNMSEAHKGKPSPLKGKKSKPYSLETRRKMSEAQQRRLNP